MFGKWQALCNVTDPGSGSSFSEARPRASAESGVTYAQRDVTLQSSMESPVEPVTVDYKDISNVVFSSG